MIYKKDNIDMSLVTCPYEEERGYISIDDEYTNNVLRLAGYTDINSADFEYLCIYKILIDKLESYCLKSPSNICYYARLVLKGRFELGEPVIATDAEYSFFYAKDVLKGRFELGEPIIATNAHYSYCYARDVVKGKFELGEPVIVTNSYYLDYYKTLKKLRK